LNARPFNARSIPGFSKACHRTNAMVMVQYQNLVLISRYFLAIGQFVRSLRLTSSLTLSADMHDFAISMDKGEILTV
jgi:hypothetical protein